MNGFHFTKIVKKTSNQWLFEGEKSLHMGKDFRPRTADTPSKCNLSISFTLAEKEGKCCQCRLFCKFLALAFGKEESRMQ